MTILAPSGPAGSLNVHGGINGNLAATKVRVRLIRPSIHRDAGGGIGGQREHGPDASDSVALAPGQMATRVPGNAATILNSHYVHLVSTRVVILLDAQRGPLSPTM